MNENDPFSIEVPRNLEPSLLEMLMELELDAFPDVGAVDEQTLVPLARYGKIIFLKHVDDPRPIGVCELMRSYQQPLNAYIFAYYVRSDWQGKGIGTAFMKRVHSVLKEDGFLFVCLTVNKLNQKAVSLYKKLGYVIKAERLAEFGTGEDRYYMEKML